MTKSLYQGKELLQPQKYCINCNQNRCHYYHAAQ
jgi:hypothetical protein